jgi:hypothetical protein
MNQIPLDQDGIDRGLPLVANGLRKYTWLQAELHRRDVSHDREYQKRFNGFYRVRRSAEWQRTFYDLLEAGKLRHPRLRDVLLEIEYATSRVEASFSSKLVATLDPSMPVIDSIVLDHLGLKLPTRRDVQARIDAIVDIHQRMAGAFQEYLRFDIGRYLVVRFQASYPEAVVTEIKMVDLVLWQTRPAA